MAGLRLALVGIRHFDANALRVWLETVDSVGELRKCGLIVVADQDHLNFESPRRAPHDSHQIRHEVRTQPAVLLVQHEKRPVLLRRQRCQREQAQTDGKYVCDRAALPFHDVLVMPVPLDVKLDAGRPVFEGLVSPQPDRLIENFLQRLSQVFLKLTDELIEELLAEVLQCLFDLRREGECRPDSFQPAFHSCLVRLVAIPVPLKMVEPFSESSG